MKIMVIDDEEDTASLFRQRFKDEIKEGLFDFQFSSSGEEAVEKIEQLENPSAVLILSDINMPGISGLQLLKQLKTTHPLMPVMMVTAYGDEANHKKAMAYNADGFINKPIDFASLKEKILKLASTNQHSPPHLHQNGEVITSHILVVDDEPSLEALIRQKFRKQIRKREMEFIFAYNGVEALNILNENKEIGIILTDINMPEMDGLTLLSKLKEQNRLYRSVVISAYGDMENIRTAMNLGASDFITKPIDLKDLETTLEKICEQFLHMKAGAEAQQHLILYKKELEIASHIQRTFMPSNFNPFPDSDKLNLYGKMFPAQSVCGDFFDFFAIGNHRLGFVIADVSGKGVPAALFMVMSKTLLRSTALANPSPQECMREVSHYLTYNNESMMFVTALYGILDINTGEVTYCDAGHIPPYIVSKNGEVSKLPKLPGIALGVLDDLELEDSLFLEKTIQLQPGDTLVLYTDGVTEALDHNMHVYPESRFTSLIEKHAQNDLVELIDSVKQDVETFAQGMDQYDDITLLCLRWNG